MHTAPLPASSGPVVLTEGHYGRLKAYNVAETSGSAAARVRLWSGVGTGATGTELATIGLASGGSTNFVYQDGTYEQFQNGVYCEIVSGAVEGSIGWF